VLVVVVTAFFIITEFAEEEAAQVAVEARPDTEQVPSITEKVLAKPISIEYDDMIALVDVTVNVH
jgi:hypothetical protein